MRLVFLCFISILCLAVSSSENTTLSKELKEISGWVFINDSTLVAHNDSGNESKLYVLNTVGKIQHKINLLNTSNVDYEDIAYDGKKYVYLGDFGNNSNTRKDLVIYKIPVYDILHNEDTEVEKIHFSYPEQKSFPPAKNEKYYDCEAMSFYNDSLYLFTKCRTEPFDGKCMVYKLPIKAGKYEAVLDTYLVIGKRDWFRDAITASDIQHNKLYLLTYNRVIVHSFKQGKAKYLAHHTFNPISQKEALAVNSRHQIYIADERQKMMGGGHLYILEEPKPKPKKK